MSIFLGRGRFSALMISVNSSTPSAAAKPRIAIPLLAHAADVPLLIIVTGIDQSVAGQREELVVNGSVKRGRVAVLEVGSAAAVDEQGVASEHASGASIANEITMVIVRVTGRVKRVQLEGADADRFSFPDRYVGVRRAALLRHRALGSGKFAQGDRRP